MSGCRRAPKQITARDVQSAGQVIDIHFSSKHIDTLLPYLQRNLAGYDSLRNFQLEEDVFPAVLFDPLPTHFQFKQLGEKHVWGIPEGVDLPVDKDSLAFFSLLELASLIRNQKISAVELTEFFLARLQTFDQTLKCVVHLTKERARTQALKSDLELQAGRYRGPLHGIPYGLKDLMTVHGYPTTWGAAPYQNQDFAYDASVVEQLDSAGAILVAKLTTGALARGDVWFGGRTVNPWDTTQGASGSSAGSASAVAAGLVPFALGTETLGSITSPSARCGISGLRPTYGRISRFGVMALAWSMDKVGPMAKSAEDCGVVFTHLLKQDERDPTLIPAAFNWSDLPISSLRMGYLKTALEEDTTYHADHARAALDTFRKMGLELIPKQLPTQFPYAAFDIILRAESGAFFDEFIRKKHVDDMMQQNQRSRANSLRQSRFIPAVEYLQANRQRRLLVEAMDTLMSDIDVLISPNNAQHQLMITNLTGHPAMSIPTGLDSLNRPTSLTLLAPLFEEAMLIRVAQAFQDCTQFEGIKPHGERSLFGSH